MALLLLRALVRIFVDMRRGAVRFFWIIPAIVIMILPMAGAVTMAADPASMVMTSDTPEEMGGESSRLIVLGGIFVSIAALGRRSLRKTSNRTHHAPAFPQQRN